MRGVYVPQTRSQFEMKVKKHIYCTYDRVYLLDRFDNMSELQAQYDFDVSLARQTRLLFDPAYL